METWQQVLTKAWEAACRKTGFTSEDQCGAVQAGRALGDLSLEEAFEKLIKEARTSKASFELLWWFMEFEDDRVPKKLRRNVLTVLVNGAPGRAAHIYRAFKGLTNDEDVFLRGYFYPTMETYREWDLAGKLTRAKNV